LGFNHCLLYEKTANFTGNWRSFFGDGRKRGKTLEKDEIKRYYLNNSFGVLPKGRDAFHLAFARTP